MDPVLALRPLIASAVAAPGAQEIAVAVKHQDRRGSTDEVTLLQRARPVEEVDVALRIRIDVRHVADLPLRRQFRPGGVDLEDGQFARLCLSGGLRRRFDSEPGRDRDED